MSIWTPKTEEQIEQENLEGAIGMTAPECLRVIKTFNRWGNLFVDEFTYGDLRADAIIIDTSKKWIRGYEIKVTRQDFLNDEKWEMYSEFCSSLSIVCPWGLIKREEINKPFGLLYVTRSGASRWERRPKNFQKREALAWTYTYFKVIETEFKRVHWSGR